MLKFAGDRESSKTLQRGRQANFFKSLRTADLTSFFDLCAAEVGILLEISRKSLE